jgi:hypothetical protein
MLDDATLFVHSDRWFGSVRLKWRMGLVAAHHASASAARGSMNVTNYGLDVQ